MAFVTICTAAELPGPGEMREITVTGSEGVEKVLCLANEGGRYAAVDNVCPHRGGPLAEGTLEAGKVLCPWHMWAFDLETGVADHNPRELVKVYPLRVESDAVQADL
jgi:nitrite reductase (NADH) small subunit